MRGLPFFGNTANTDDCKFLHLFVNDLRNSKFIISSAYCRLERCYKLILVIIIYIYIVYIKRNEKYRMKNNLPW